jgi:glycosyltransferase involved in cell wall biosynthesis
LSDPEFSHRALQVIVNIERRLAKVTKTLITVGEQVSKDLLEVGVGKPSQYISIASEGQKLNFLSREQARANLGIELETPVVLWMARMAPVKNPSLALEVARLLPKISFLMAGGGEIFNQIRDSAPANVKLLSWVDAAEVIPVADIFLSTSLNEGVPYSLLEVLSAGVPVVAVESGAIAEIIEDQLNGFLTSREPAEIASQIDILFANSALRLNSSISALESSALSSKKNDMVLKHLSLYIKDV